MFLFRVLAGRFISGIREAPGEPAALRFLRESNGNNTGTWVGNPALTLQTWY